MNSRLLTTEQAAEALNVPINTLRYWETRKEAPASFLMGRRRMYREESIADFIAEKERAEKERVSA